MVTTPDEDALKITEIKTKDLEYFISLVDKTVAGHKMTDSNFESSTMDKILSNNIECYREIVYERKSQLCGKFHRCLIF